MTKRILAVVLAVVMCLSVMSFEAFADYVAMTITAEHVSGTTIKVSWSSVPGAAKYTVGVVNASTGASAGGTTVTTTSATINVSGYGDFKVNVTAIDSTNGNVGGGNASVNIPQSSTVGSITVKSNGTGSSIISWTATAGVNEYYYSYTYMEGSSQRTANGTTTALTVTVPVSYENLRSVTLRIGNANGVSVGTWSYSPSTVNPNNPNTGTTGGVSISGTRLYWNNYGNATYFITAYTSSYSSGTLLNRYNNGYSTSYDFQSLLNSYTTVNTIYFTVESYLNGVYSTIGTATYTRGGYWSNNYSIQVTPYSNGTAYVTWVGYSGASSYRITVNGTDVGGYYNSPATVTFNPGLTTNISVVAVVGNSTVLLGSATITPTGNSANPFSVTYTGGYNNGGYNNGYGYGYTGTTVQGNNCYLVVGTNSTVVNIYNNTYTTGYTVVYTIDGVSRQTTGSGSAVTIPVGASKNFQVLVIAGNNIVATATYTSATNGGNSSSTPTTSSTKNLTLTAKTNSTTTVSWAEVPNASLYEVDYVRNGVYTSEPQYTVKTSYDIPFGKNIAFTVYVYAYVNGVPKTVGTAVHAAGDDFETKKDDSSTTKPADKTEEKLSAYVTGFKGTVGNTGSITLAWNAASGNPNYEVWYKKSTASTWKKIYTTAGRALRINKLTNGTSYDFKVVANGRDSGILTMTIGTVASTKTAPDPAGAGTSVSAVPVINSISGGDGSITVSWSAASGCTKYQVWVASGNSNTYSKKGEVSGTSATVTGLSAGSYKVRIKASKDGKTWPKFNDDSCIKSDYRTVDVK